MKIVAAIGLAFWLAAAVSQHYEYRRLGRSLSDFNPLHIVLAMAMEWALAAVAIWVLIV